MTTYKVETSFSAWSFGEAYSFKDGDILWHLKKVYAWTTRRERHYKIEKKHQNSWENFGTEGGGTLYHNTIAATLRIMNELQFSLKIFGFK